jgi:hypothetical protein
MSNVPFSISVFIWLADGWDWYIDAFRPAAPGLSAIYLLRAILALISLR